MVGKKGKQIRARPSPLFGQCPKELDFSYGRCSLTLKTDHLRPSLLVSVLDIYCPGRPKTPTNLMLEFSGANSYSGSPNGGMSNTGL